MFNFEEIKSALILSRSKGVGASQFKFLIDKYKLPSVALNTWKEEQTMEKSVRRIVQNLIPYSKLFPILISRF